MCPPCLSGGVTTCPPDGERRISFSLTVAHELSQDRSRSFSPTSATITLSHRTIRLALCLVVISAIGVVVKDKQRALSATIVGSTPGGGACFMPHIWID